MFLFFFIFVMFTFFVRMRFGQFINMLWDLTISEFACMSFVYSHSCFISAQFWYANHHRRTDIKTDENKIIIQHLYDLTCLHLHRAFMSYANHMPIDIWEFHSFYTLQSESLSPPPLPRAWLTHVILFIIWAIFRIERRGVKNRKSNIQNRKNNCWVSSLSRASSNTYKTHANANCEKFRKTIFVRVVRRIYVCWTFRHSNIRPAKQSRAFSCTFTPNTHHINDRIIIFNHSSTVNHYLTPINRAPQWCAPFREIEFIFAKTAEQKMHTK